MTYAQAITVLENLRIQQAGEHIKEALALAIEALELMKREQDDGR